MGGIFVRWFPTKYGDASEFILVFPEKINVHIDEFGTATESGPGEERILTRFSIPPLAGFDMAYQDLKANGFDGFKYGDKVLIECTEIQPASSKDQSPMPMFTINVDMR